MAKTANEIYLDGAIVHQIIVRRYANHEVRKVLSLLEEADRDLTVMLRKRLPTAGSFGTRRLAALLDSVRSERDAVMAAVQRELEGALPGLAVVEHDAELKLITRSIPVEVNYARVPVETLRALASDKPFQGQLLKDWFSSISVSDQAALTREIQLGVVEGASVKNIVSRIVGTRKNGFKDGILSMTRRGAEAMTRTAINHVSNAAREEVWTANEDVVTALRWVSTLDGRTTPICQARDGKVAPMEGKPQPKDTLPLEPPGARPPAHWGCRSVMVAYFDGSFVANERPFVRDTRTGERRQLDFAKEAREAGRTTKQVRDEWVDKNIGRVPAQTTYSEWLKDQPASFQDDVLGKAKGQMFRSGEATLDQFADSRGKELTLAQLGAL